MTPVDELRAAAERLRSAQFAGAMAATPAVAAREPLAAWLDGEVESLLAHLPRWDGSTWLAERDVANPAPRGYRRPDIVAGLVEHHYRHALAVARAINGAATSPHSHRTT